MNPQTLCIPAEEREFYVSEEDEPFYVGDEIEIDGILYFVTRIKHGLKTNRMLATNVRYLMKYVYLKKAEGGD